MAEGEHTIISNIPRERLNQIAGRKLSELAIPVRLGADRATLEGELAFASSITNPVNGAPIARARFVVVGHDRLRFVDTALAALSPIPFGDVDRSGAIEARVADLVRKRAAILRQVAERLRAVGLEVSFDPDRLLVRAIAKTTGHAFELLGGPGGIRISRTAPVGGAPVEVPATIPAIELHRLGNSAELERWLQGSIDAMRAAPPTATAAAHGSDVDARVELTPPPRNALTLARIAEAFGGDAVMAPNAPVEVFHDVEHGGTRYRFVATREVGTRFRGRLIGPSGDVWSDSFDLERFPGAASVVAAALGAPSAEPAPDASPSSDVPEYLMPHPGEVWVMSVHVEQSGADEVRWVGTDIDGRPYGAARVLKRSEFEAAFSQERGAWRLLVLIEQVRGGSVLYRQLDSKRQPIGTSRTMPVAVMVANFAPEAAAY